MTYEMGRGTEHLQRQASEGRSSRGSGYRKLWLYSGDTARFWFMTDGAEVASPLIHMKALRKRDGGTWNKDVLCEKSSAGDETECQYCDAPRVPSADGDGDTWAFPGPNSRAVAFVYVEYINHALPKQGQDWERVERGGSTVYVETVNGVQLLIMRQRLTDQLVNAYTGANDPDRGGEPTLLDRPYRLERIGAKQQTQEILTAGAAAEMPIEVRETMNNLPDLAETCYKEFYDGRISAGGGNGHDPTVQLPAGVAAAPSTSFNPGDDTEIAF